MTPIFSAFLHKEGKSCLARLDLYIVIPSYSDHTQHKCSLAFNQNQNLYLTIGKVLLLPELTNTHMHRTLELSRLINVVSLIHSFKKIVQWTDKTLVKVYLLSVTVPFVVPSSGKINKVYFPSQPKNIFCDTWQPLHRYPGRPQCKNLFNSGFVESVATVVVMGLPNNHSSWKKLWKATKIENEIISR